MQPSEMTNDELASYIVNTIGGGIFKEYYAEVAARLRKLKVAEDALEKIDNMCDGDMCKFFDTTHHCSACRYLDECQTGVAHAALHEIREKGQRKQVKKGDRNEDSVL